MQNKADKIVLKATQERCEAQGKEIIRLHGVIRENQQQAMALHGVMDSVLLALARKYGEADGEGGVYMRIPEVKIADKERYACHTSKDPNESGMLLFTAVPAKEGPTHGSN